jgi:hypothetical protein
MKQLLVVLLFLATLLPLSASAQTTQAYFANSGYVSPGNAVRAYPLTATLPDRSTVSGEDFNSPNGMGAGCYWGGCRTGRSITTLLVTCYPRTAPLPTSQTSPARPTLARRTAPCTCNAPSLRELPMALTRSVGALA